VLAGGALGLTAALFIAGLASAGLGVLSPHAANNKQLVKSKAEFKRMSQFLLWCSMI
jgi:hypothetical protein